jgi:hypothetical protein
MIGGPSDVVVEANIVRAAAPARDGAPQRPEALPRAVPMNEGNMWPLQPEPAPAPVPAPRQPRAPVAEDSMQWQEPEPMLPPPRRPEPRPEMRPEPRAEMRPEPRAEMRPEPRPEMRPEPRPEMRPEPRPEMRPERTDVRAERMEARPDPRTVDPLAGLAAELSRVQPETAAPKMRPPREREIPRARAPLPERMRAPPLPPAAAPTEDPSESNADQNLAEMAHRLEAALRRPKPAEPRASETLSKQPMMPSAAPEPMLQEPVAEPSPHDDAPPAAPQPRGAAPGKPQKSVYDSLEQEMASLLGRPNSKA